MEETKKLYPIKFCTIQDEYNWGHEEFKFADLGYKDSLVREGWLAGNSIGELMDTYIDRISGDNTYEYYGRQFPVCIRRLSINGDLPLQVHPGDEIAAQRYDFLGKEKLWYVLGAGKNARILAGFRDNCNASDFYAACETDRTDEMMNIIAPYPGLALKIPSGVPHAASGDMEILEIAESSPLDFCLNGRGHVVSEDEFDPQLSLVDALDFIKFEKFTTDPSKGNTLVDIPAFTATKMNLTDPLRCNNAEYDSFIVYCCVSGAASVQIQVLGQTADFPLKAGETMLIPAECQDFTIVPTAEGTVLIEVTSNRVETDEYIDPKVSAKLPGEE